MACQVEGEPVLGDALVALLPKIDQDSFPQWGADAPLFVGEFTGRWMKKLGMKIATTISCASLGRWSKIEKEEGHYIWHDEAVDTGLKYNLEVIGYLGLKYPPPCVVQNFTKDGKITDETGFTKAFCRYVDAFVRHYAGRIRVIHLDDEIKDQGYTGDQLKRILKAAHDAAKQAAKASNTEVAIGYNIWNSKWKQFLEWMEPEYEYIDFISMNTNLRPSRAVEGLNISRAKGCYTEFYYTNGGRRSRMRTTSLILARKGGTGDHPSLFAWEMLAHAWLSRPYGTEDVKDGPIIRYGYYDMRTLGQSSYMPSAKLGLVEYDNSPTLGAQAMAMVKYAISGLRPVRDPKQPYSLEGKSTGTVKLNAFPFRDKEKAVVWIMTKDGSDLGSSWRLSGFNFKDFPPLDLYARPLQLQKDGSVVTRELPVYFCVSAHHLNACLEALQGLKGELMPHSDQRFKLEMLPYIVDVDPERKGVIRLSIVQEKGKELVVVEGIEGRPELTKPGISITKGRLQTMVLLTFDDARQLTIELTDKGCQFFWSDQNSTEKIKKREIYFVLGQGGAGRKILIQEGEKVIAGVLRKSDGEFLPDQEAPPPHDLVSNSSLVILGNVARVDLSASSGVGFSPPTGFLWKLRDGKASLESAYTLKPYAGGGTRGVQKIEMRMSIFVAKP